VAFPTTSAPALNNWQIQYNSLTMGAGTSYGITKVMGLGDLPNISQGDVQRPRDPGEFIGLYYPAGRTVEVDFWLSTLQGSNIQTILQNLATAVVPSANTELPLWIQLPNLPCLAAMTRPIRKVADYDTNYSAAQVSTPIVQWHATDPRLYASPTTTTTAAASTTVSAAVSVVNAGNVDARPIFTITGPIAAGFTITASGAATGTLTYNNALASGDTLVIDTDVHTVQQTHSGTTTNTRSYLGNLPGWFTATASGTTTVTLAGTGGTIGTTAITAKYASAYLI
jgi:hypothetical protein